VENDHQQMKKSFRFRPEQPRTHRLNTFFCRAYSPTYEYTASLYIEVLIYSLGLHDQILGKQRVTGYGCFSSSHRGLQCDSQRYPELIAGCCPILKRCRGSWRVSTSKCLQRIRFPNENDLVLNDEEMFRCFRLSQSKQKASRRSGN
jgi:hypothetical protein